MTVRWSNQDIDWSRFDHSKVDPDLLKAVKAAALVEHNADDYVAYLKSVFAADPDFSAATDLWGAEEVQHGRALAAWAQMADPAWDFQAALGRFRACYRLPLDATESVRGSLTGELIARCVVEVGTSSMYSAIRDAAAEPVLKQIAARIAGDEFRHYKLFYDHFRRHEERRPLSLFTKAQIAVGRIAEASDDELASAWWAANAWHQPYDRKRFAEEYTRQITPLYRPGHVQRGISMVLKACSLDPQGRLADYVSRFVWNFIRFKNWRLARAA